jgi:hypothetical protein
LAHRLRQSAERCVRDDRRGLFVAALHLLDLALEHAADDEPLSVRALEHDRRRFDPGDRTDQRFECAQMAAGLA